MRARAAALVTLAGAVACGTGAPRAIVWGQDQCEHCHMAIADQRYAAAIVTRTGRTHLFDDAGCMAQFVASGGVAPDEVRGYWASDVLAPGELHPVDGLRFIRSDSFRTPMASGLGASAAGRADSLAAAVGGRPMAWRQVLDGEPGTR